MGQSQAARAFTRSNSSSSEAALSEFKGIAEPVKHATTVSTSASSDGVHRISNASCTSMNSDSSDLPALLNDQHVLESEKTDSSLTLMSIAELLCDLAMEVDAKFRVIHANGRIDRFFQSEVEGRSVLDLVPQADHEEVETALRTISLTRSRLLRTLLLCDNGIGTIEAKLLIMRCHDATNAPWYVIGVRTEQMHGLTSTVRSTYDSETSDINTFALPSASIAPTLKIHDSPFGWNSRTSNASSHHPHGDHQWSDGNLCLPPGSIMPLDNSPTGVNRQRRNSRTSNTSSHYSQAPLSEVSFNVSHAPSVRSMNSLAYTASTISSALGFGGARWSKRGPSQRGTRNMSVKSGLSLASLRSRSKQRVQDQVDAEVQTEKAENSQAERGTQTESSHVPLTKALRRPPPNPSSLRSSQRSSNERERRPSICSKQSKQSSCKSTVSSNKMPGNHYSQHRLSHVTNVTSVTNLSVESSGTRRAHRANTEGKARRASECSTTSADLVIRHFDATPINTIMFFIDTVTERINVHDNGFSCCFWHATVRTIATAVSSLNSQGCKGSYWLPSSGWQCRECFALNDVDEDECNICCGDRNPLRDTQAHLTQLSGSDRSEASDEA